MIFKKRSGFSPKTCEALGCSLLSIPVSKSPPAYIPYGTLTEFNRAKLKLITIMIFTELNVHIYKFHMEPIYILCYVTYEILIFSPLIQHFFSTHNYVITSTDLVIHIRS